MEKKIEIFFEDLTEKAQQAILDEFETTRQAENWDVIPMTVIVRDMED